MGGDQLEEKTSDVPKVLGDDVTVPSFIAADTFEGPRPGYVFKTLGSRTGYFVDNMRKARAVAALKADEARETSSSPSSLSSGVAVPPPPPGSAAPPLPPGPS